MNAEKTETRNSANGMKEKHTSPGMVGGRHGYSPSGQPRGGYLNICSETKITIQDLKNILRHPVLAKTAEEIGADAFVSIWRMVNELQDESVWLRLPKFS